MHSLLLLTALLTGDGLTFAQALSHAERAPRVQAESRAAERRSDLAAELSSMTHNPNVQLQPGARAFDGGGTAPEIYVGVVQRFNLRGAAGSRRDALQAEITQDQATVGVTRQATRRQCALAWITRWSAQHEHALIAAHIAQVDAWMQGADTAREAGELTRVDTGMLRLYRAEVALQAHDVEATAIESGLQLSAATGRADGEVISAAGELPVTDLPSATQYAIEHVPEVRAARAVQQSAERRLIESHAEVGPTVGVGAYGWREGGGDTALLATIDIDVPLFEIGGRARAAESAELERTRGASEQAVVEAHVERAGLFHEVEHAEQTAVLVAEQRAAAEGLVQAQSLRWQAREATTQELLNAQRAALDAAIASVRAEAAVALSRFLLSERLQSGAQQP